MYHITFYNQSKLVKMQAHTAAAALGYSKFLISCGINCTVVRMK